MQLKQTFKDKPYIISSFKFSESKTKWQKNYETQHFVLRNKDHAAHINLILFIINNFSWRQIHLSMSS